MAAKLDRSIVITGSGSGVVHVPATIDVRRIRRKAAMSQDDFARHFGVGKRAVQDWEQGRRPEPRRRPVAAE